MTSRKAIARHWSAVFDQSLPDGLCWSCGIERPTRAHIIPHRDGGGRRAGNLLLACKLCNDVVDILASTEGAAVAVEWVRACITTGWRLPPLAGMQTALWRASIEAGVDMPTAEKLFGFAFRAYAEQLHRLIDQRAKGSRLKHGSLHGGTPPIGLVADDTGRLVDGCAKEARAVALILAWRAEGLSVRAIAEKLQQSGIKARGYRWWPATVGRIIRRQGEQA